MIGVGFWVSLQKVGFGRSGHLCLGPAPDYCSGLEEGFGVLYRKNSIGKNP